MIWCIYKLNQQFKARYMVRIEPLSAQSGLCGVFTSLDNRSKSGGKLLYDFYCISRNKEICDFEQFWGFWPPGPTWRVGRCIFGHPPLPEGSPATCHPPVMNNGLPHMLISFDLFIRALVLTI